MNKLFNRNDVFSALLFVVVVAIGYRVTPVHVDPVFNMVLSKNRSTIVDVHQGRDIEVSQTVSIDRIDLTDKSRFRHPKLGDLGYGNDFWADISADFMVKKAGNYNFYMSSDDGFILSIDGRQLCEWTHDRPLTTDACNINLSEGNHKFTLVYFQGYGNAGLSMQYAYTADGTMYYVGDNSKYLKFH